MRTKKVILLCIISGLITNMTFNNVALGIEVENFNNDEEKIEIQIDEEKIEIQIDEEKIEIQIDEEEDNTITDDNIENEAIEEIGKENKFDSNGGQAWELKDMKEQKDFNIISNTNIKKETAKRWAQAKGATQEFIDLADLYWKYSSDHGNVNPAVAFIQSAKETGFGKFGGVIDSSFKNPCGLKTRTGGADNDPNAHQRFNTWDEGVKAHLDHLALYAGANGYPREDTFDPRHFKSIFGVAKTVQSLGGKWAPSQTYGKEILTRYYDLLNEEESDNKYGWQEENGYIYYIDINGQVVKGLNVIDGDTYFMDDNGVVKYGWQFVNANWKYFDNSGRMVTGWLLLEDWYYLKTDGSIAQGREVIDGIEYYFNDSGRMQRSWQFVDGAWSYFNDGIMHKGWLLLEDWYYLKTDGKIAQGREVIDGIEYYFNDSGRMQRSWQFIDGAWSYFNDGIMHKGWLLLEDWYYLKNNGKIAQGREVIDGIEYYFNDSGRMLRGWQFINGKWSYFNDGIKHKGWFEEYGEKYYLDQNGNMAIGWIYIGRDRYYFDQSGKMQKNTIIDGFELDSDGKVIEKLVDIIDPKLQFNFGLEGPEPNKPNKLIMHHAAGNSTVYSVHDYHKNGNGWAGIGYHFYIHKDGTIYKGRDESWRGAHAAEVGPDDGDKSNDINATSLGISVQGDYTKENMPKVQEEAIIKVGKYAVKKYGISSIFKHGDKGIGQTNCPGKNYPFERIKAKILADSVFIYDVDNLE